MTHSSSATAFESHFDEIVEASGVIRTALSFPESAPFFRGHFPGSPVVPGIVLVESVCQLLCKRTGPGKRLRLIELALARFTAPAQPGERVSIELKIEEKGVLLSAEGSLTTATGPVANLRLVMSPEFPAPEEGSAAAKIDLERLWKRADDGGASSAAILNCLPHRFPMLLIDSVVNPAPGESPLVLKALSLSEPCYERLLERGLPPSAFAYPQSLLIESLCQSCGIALVQKDRCAENLVRERTQDRLPVLGKIVRFRFFADVFPGETLCHHPRIMVESEDAAVVAGETYSGSRKICSVDKVVVAFAGGTTTLPQNEPVSR